MKSAAILLSLSMIWFVSGCANYEFDVIQPAADAGRVGSARETFLPIPPLTCSLQSCAGRLVMRIHNPTPEPIELLGDRSYVVDPNGQSHPLRTRTIAPRSFIKLILPPLPPAEIEEEGPVFGLEVGDPEGYGLLRGPLAPWPRYRLVDRDDYYWEWNDQGDVRLSLCFGRPNQTTFTESFLFHRRRL